MSASKPRVLMVGPWPPTQGGVTTFMRNVVGSPLNAKYAFVPFTTSRPAKRNARGDNYGYLAVFRGGFKRVAQGVFITLWHLAIYPWVVLTRRPAVIQVQASDYQAFWEATLYVLMAKALGRPVMLRIGGSFNRFYDSSGAGARAAIRWALRRPDLVLVQSEYWKDYLRALAPAAPMAVLNNFVPETLIERRIAPAERRFLLYCGEAPGLKGAYVLLAAMRGLLERGVKADITLIAVCDHLRQEVAAAGLDRHCTMTGYLSHGETLQALRATDVFLQISSSEGFPNMLLEAMALGCAAIVTPVGAVPEVVGPDGECAFVIDVGDAAALAERMARLAADPALLARLGAGAQARVAGRFTDGVALRVLDNAYQALIRARLEPRRSGPPAQQGSRGGHLGKEPSSGPGT